jgi:hypothetical protein
MKEFIDVSPPYLLAGMAGVCLISAVILIWKGRLKPAFMMSSLFVVVVLLVYFPQLDSLKAFMIDVKLRTTLDRAEEILGRLRKLSVVNARLGYTTLAWGNRLGTPKAADKQKVLDAFDEQLISLNVSDGERDEIKWQYVRFIAFDFSYLFIQTIDHTLDRRKEALTSNLQKQPTDDDRTALQRLVQYQSEWRAKNINLTIDAIPLDAFQKYLQDRVPVDALSQNDILKLRKVADTIAELFDASKKKGGYTDEAAAFYDTYYDDGMGTALYKRTFESD